MECGQGPPAQNTDRITKSQWPVLGSQFVPPKARWVKKPILTEENRFLARLALWPQTAGRVFVPAAKRRDDSDRSLERNLLIAAGFPEHNPPPFQQLIPAVAPNSTPAEIAGAPHQKPESVTYGVEP
jgi:hypothetical protein